MAKATKPIAHSGKPVTVEWACKTLNKWGFHVRDQGDKLMCFHTTLGFDAQIALDNDGTPDRKRFDQIIDAVKTNRGYLMPRAAGVFKSAPEFSRPITIQER